MQEIEVQIIGAEPLQTRGAGSERQVSSRVTRQHLTHEKYVLATLCDRLADELLGRAVAIHLRCIDEGHAEIETKTNRGDLVVALARALTHAPGAQAKRGQGLARW